MSTTDQRTHPDGLKVKSRVQVGLSPIRPEPHLLGITCQPRSMSDSAIMHALTNHIFGFRFSMMSFPVPFEAMEKLGDQVAPSQETFVRPCVGRRARYHNSFLISLSRPRKR